MIWDALTALTLRVPQISSIKACLLLVPVESLKSAHPSTCNHASLRDWRRLLRSKRQYNPLWNTMSTRHRKWIDPTSQPFWLSNVISPVATIIDHLTTSYPVVQLKRFVDTWRNEACAGESCERQLWGGASVHWLRSAAVAAALSVTGWPRGEG